MAAGRHASGSAQRPRVALVYAPFGRCATPALGLSLLKSELARDGVDCDVHYVNLLLARELGVGLYDLVADAVPCTALLGEWLSAPCLEAPDGQEDAAWLRGLQAGDGGDVFTPAVVLGLLRIRDRLPAFVDRCVAGVDWGRYDWVGFSVSGQQNCASLAMARRIKAAHPAVRIVFGGANCFAPMGEALLRAFPFVDHVCAGYGDEAFPALVAAVAAGDERPVVPGILSRAGGRPEGVASAREPHAPADLDTLPYPDFSDYLTQLAAVDRPAGYDVRLLVEASRGCWWAERGKCTFCGFNGTLGVYRSKSPGRVVDELDDMGRTYGLPVQLADNVPPPDYLRALVPLLADRAPEVATMELRADVTREDVALLAAAGVRALAPGIESLSDRVLRLMRKGTTVAHNVQLLKWAGEEGLSVFWNLLWGFPGEEPADYEEMLRVLPLLAHLHPPTRIGHIRFDRFSAYLEDPARWGLTGVRPAAAYRAVYPGLGEADLRDIVYFFEADYDDRSAEYAPALRAACEAWQGCAGAALDLTTAGGGVRLEDTRAGELRVHLLDGTAAHVYLLCDAARTADELCREPALAGAGAARVQTLLDGFAGQGLMLRLGRRYLSLAVRREQPGA